MNTVITNIRVLCKSYDILTYMSIDHNATFKYVCEDNLAQEMEFADDETFLRD